MRVVEAMMGLVPKTAKPVPVSSVSIAASLALISMDVVPKSPAKEDDETCWWKLFQSVEERYPFCAPVPCWMVKAPEPELYESGVVPESEEEEILLLKVVQSAPVRQPKVEPLLVIHVSVPPTFESPEPRRLENVCPTRVKKVVKLNPRAVMPPTKVEVAEVEALMKATVGELVAVMVVELVQLARVPAVPVPDTAPPPAHAPHEGKPPVRTRHVPSAPFVSFESTFVAEEYRTSPDAYEESPVPPWVGKSTVAA